MRTILVVGGGYTGFYTAWKLEKKLHRGEARVSKPKRYVHHSLGTVATLGLGRGIFQFHRLVIKGFPAWLMHRSHHVLAVPTWERKARVNDDVVRRLAAACNTGDVTAIEAHLDPDAVAVCDSGGRVPAPFRPVYGAAEVASVLGTLLPGADLSVESVNGRAGLAVRRAGTAVAVIAVSCHQNRATALWVVLSPAKLRGWHRR